MTRFTSRFASVLIVTWACFGIALGACGGGDAQPDARAPDAPPPAGALNLSWQITYNGATLTCADVGALSVSITATPVQGGSGVAEAFGCDQGVGTTPDFRAGAYNIEIELVASGSVALAAPYVVSNFNVLAGAPSSLGEVAFEVAPRGNVSFRIENNTGKPNCAAEADGGAGITELHIEFRNAAGTCVPVTFAIAEGAGGGAAGTYASDCAGARYACVDSDQILSAEGVPSGTNSMVITGYKGTEACFVRMPQFSVPGADQTVELLPQTLVREMIPACDPQGQ